MSDLTEIGHLPKEKFKKQVFLLLMQDGGGFLISVFTASPAMLPYITLVKRENAAALC